LAAQELDCLVIEDYSVVSDYAIVTVAIIRVQSDICVNLDVRVSVLEELDGPLDEAVWIKCLFADRRLQYVGSLEEESRERRDKD